LSLKERIVNIDSIIEIVLGSLLLGMVIVIFLQIIFRYLLKSSLPWSEELARYFQVWLTFIGSAYAIRKKSHISLSGITDRLPNRIKMRCSCIVDICVLAFIIVILIQGIKIVGIITYQTSPSMGIPMKYIYIAIPASAVLSIFYIMVKYMGKKS